MLVSRTSSPLGLQFISTMQWSIFIVAYNNYTHPPPPKTDIAVIDNSLSNYILLMKNHPDVFSLRQIILISRSMLSFSLMFWWNSIPYPIWCTKHVLTRSYEYWRPHTPWYSKHASHYRHRSSQSESVRGGGKYRLLSDTFHINTAC